MQGIKIAKHSPDRTVLFRDFCSWIDEISSVSQSCEKLYGSDYMKRSEDANDKKTAMDSAQKSISNAPRTNSGPAPEFNLKVALINRGITIEDVISLASTGMAIAQAKAREQKTDLIIKIRGIRVIEARLENQHLLVQPAAWRQNGTMTI